MALSPAMQCFKVCGYLCGALAALNIWFWIGMTIMQATASDGMGNPWINSEILKYDKFLDRDANRFVTVFAACIGVSSPQPFAHILDILYSSTSFASSDAAIARPANATKTKIKLSTSQAAWAKVTTTSPLVSLVFKAVTMDLPSLTAWV